jgi:hypothetical protein
MAALIGRVPCFALAFLEVRDVGIEICAAQRGHVPFYIVSPGVQVVCPCLHLTSQKIDTDP